MAAFIAQTNECGWCTKAHAAVADRAYRDAAKVSAALSDLETAAIEEPLRATLRTLHRLPEHSGDRASPPLEVHVEPLALPLTDPLSRVDGVMNALVIETDPVREVTIIGRGAEPEQAGQDMFADLVAVARSPHGDGTG